MTRILRIALAWSLLGASALSAQTLRVEGSAFVIDDGQGQVLRGQALVGTEIDLPDGSGSVRIDGVELDSASRFGDIWLHTLRFRGAGQTHFEPLCPATAGGETHAVVMQGYFDSNLRYVADPSRFSLSCTSGVQAKCLRWGYRPWAQTPEGNTSMAPWYEACVHLARADYCGNNQPSTRDGTEIDLYDYIGVQSSERSLQDMRFEAGWSPRGAVCVHHPRIAGALDLERLAMSCPRLQPERLGQECTDQRASELGALLFNRSRP